MEWVAFGASVLTALLSFLGVYISNRKSAAVMEYRIKQLETKVDKHNNVIERTYKLEQEVKDMKEQRRA
jgi:hypothetical protein